MVSQIGRKTLFWSFGFLSNVTLASCHVSSWPSPRRFSKIKYTQNWCVHSPRPFSLRDLSLWQTEGSNPTPTSHPTPPWGGINLNSSFLSFPMETNKLIFTRLRECCWSPKAFNLLRLNTQVFGQPFRLPFYGLTLCARNPLWLGVYK